MDIEKSILLELKSKLLKEQTDLKEELAVIGKPTNSTSNYETVFNNIGDHEDENASEVEEYTDNIALENNLEIQLKNVNEALKKINDGTYGFCEKCSNSIDIERLKAFPAAKTCISCT